VYFYPDINISRLCLSSSIQTAREEIEIKMEKNRLPIIKRDTSKIKNDFY